jgi:hypothetical protein
MRGIQKSVCVKAQCYLGFGSQLEDQPADLLEPIQDQAQVQGLVEEDPGEETANVVAMPR